MLVALFDAKRSHKLKQIMAEQFEGMDGMMEAIEGPDGSTIISERNKVALAGLKEQIAAGKKRIGIFYGAGHMPDMEQVETPVRQHQAPPLAVEGIAPSRDRVRI